MGECPYVAIEICYLDDNGARIPTSTLLAGEGNGLSVFPAA